MKQKNKIFCNIRVFLYFFSFLFCVSCATLPDHGEIPKDEADFRLPPDELIAKFPIVAEKHFDTFEAKSKPFHFFELKDAWGNQDDSTYRPNWGTWGVVGGMSGMIMLQNGVWFPELFVFDAAVVSGFELLMPIRTAYWHKGDYEIRAAVQSYSIKDVGNVRVWEWFYKGQTDNIVQNRLVDIYKQKPWYYQITFSGGGDSLTGTSYQTSRLGNALYMLSLGRVVFLPKGFELFAMASAEPFSVWRSPYALEGDLYYRFSGAKASLGFGVNYHFKSDNILVYEGNSWKTYEFRPSLGYLCTFDYRTDRVNSFGIRLEYSPVTRSDGRKISGDNLGLYVRTHF